MPHGVEVLGSGASLWIAGEVWEGGRELSGPESAGSLVGMLGGKEAMVGIANDGSGGD